MGRRWESVQNVTGDRSEVSTAFSGGTKQKHGGGAERRRGEASPPPAVVLGNESYNVSSSRCSYTCLLGFSPHSHRGLPAQSAGDQHPARELYSSSSREMVRTTDCQHPNLPQSS